MDNHNGIHTNLKYAMEKEQNYTLNYLEVKLHRRGRKIHIGIYHKPTQTDITIHNTSNHPVKYKHAAYNYMRHRIIPFLLHKELNPKNITE
jgi:hypothetical protein